MPAPAWHIFTEDEPDFIEMLDAFRNNRSGIGNIAEGILPLEVLAAIERAKIDFKTTRSEPYFSTVKVDNADAIYAFLAIWRPTHRCPILEITVWDYEPTEEELTRAA